MPYYKVDVKSSGIALPGLFFFGNTVNRALCIIFYL